MKTVQFSLICVVLIVNCVGRWDTSNTADKGIQFHYEGSINTE